MDAIQQLLKINKDSYERIVFKQWFHYCELYALKNVNHDHHGNTETETNLEDFQKLLANTALFNYWREAFEKYEMRFVELAKPFYNKSDPADLKKLYESTVWEVKYHYSRPLFTNARKLNLNPILN
ncbi:MAG: hypothetical protein JJE55_07065 [Flavobacteriaceae bacterium]|nr:hypothetical protein [Flavobacteriaceae bacterium]